MPGLNELASECVRLFEAAEAARTAEKRAKKAHAKAEVALAKNGRVEKVRDMDELLVVAEKTARLERAQEALDAAKKVSEAARVEAEEAWRRLVELSKSALPVES